MLAIPRVIVSDILRKNAWLLVLMGVAANLLPLLILYGLKTSGDIGPAYDQYNITPHLFLVQISGLVFCAAVYAAVGKPSRLFALPIRNSAIALTLFLTAGTLLFGHSLASWWVLGMVFKLDWPIFGPALAISLGAVFLLAGFWFAEKSLWIIPIVGVIGAVVGLWFKSRYGGVFGHPTEFWRSVSLFDTACMAAIALCTYFLGVAGVARNRRGDPALSTGLIQWIDRRFGRSASDVRPMNGPFAAQLWFDQRQRGWVLPGIVIAVTLFCGVVWLIFIRDLDTLIGGAVGGGWFLLAEALIAALVLGHLGTIDGRFDMRVFLATRPLTNQQIAHSLLKTAVRSVSTSYLLWIGVLLLTSGIASTLGHTAAAKQNLLHFGWFFYPGILFATWTITTVLACIGAANLTSNAVKISTVVCLLAAFVILGSVQDFRPNVRHAVNTGLMCALGLSSILITLKLYCQAIKLEFVRPRGVFYAAIAWIGMITLGYFGTEPRQELRLGVYALILGATSLGVLPFAAMPIAIARNRTR